MAEHPLAAELGAALGEARDGAAAGLDATQPQVAMTSGGLVGPGFCRRRRRVASPVAAEASRRRRRVASPVAAEALAATRNTQTRVVVSHACLRLVYAILLDASLNKLAKVLTSSPRLKAGDSPRSPEGISCFMHPSRQEERGTMTDSEMPVDSGAPPAMEEPLPSGGPGQGYEIVEKGENPEGLETRETQ